MIDHLFIKNYKVFDRQNIPLDKNTLLIGTHNSGKTTALEALDLFFNHHLKYDAVRDKEKSVVVEVHINDERYRKVFSPPSFEINYKKCIGNMFDINHLKFLYLPSNIDNNKLLNDLLTINMTKKTDNAKLALTVKTFDYLDGILGNSNFPIFKIETKYWMNINHDMIFTKDDYTTLLSNINYQYTIIGIDNYENNFDIDALHKLTKFSYQTILSTKIKEVVDKYNYFITPLYKDDEVLDVETAKNLVSVNPKTYLLVEGKYDVAWFEQGLKLLDLSDNYRVIPCGGAGNIEYIEAQLKKEGIKTIVITDGDVESKQALKEEVIELYADVDYINKRFHTEFKEMPTSKKTFFKAISVKDDIVKKILSSWARKNLKRNSKFVNELKLILERG